MLADWTKRITYKAGWSIYASAADYNREVWITVAFTGPNSSGDGPERKISHHRLVSAPRNVSEFVREVIVTIQELENHEMREWLRVDGEHWPDYLPHGPQAVMEPLRNVGASNDDSVE